MSLELQSKIKTEMSMDGVSWLTRSILWPGALLCACLVSWRSSHVRGRSNGPGARQFPGDEGLVGGGRSSSSETKTYARYSLGSQLLRVRAMLKWNFINLNKIFTKYATSIIKINFIYVIIKYTFILCVFGIIHMYFIIIICQANGTMIHHIIISICRNNRATKSNYFCFFCMTSHIWEN
jgi:hypothetical protein